MQLQCSDLGWKCDFVATGTTADEVKTAMFSHAAKAHKALLSKMTEEDKKRMAKKMDGFLAMSAAAAKPDKVVHFEIPADNVARAQQFYSSVFSWQISRAPMPGPEYYLITTTATDKKNMPVEAGSINGGMMKRMAKEGPVVVVNVNSLDAALKKVQQAGGKVVMPKMQVGDIGLYARVMDTEGNVIGVWQNVKK
ncbi:MAG: DUF1059 domain-containing protein [Candidatus Aenigmarchaeota archaeon]|nr:DUF1059 domain-containing protein [Candidatus Aenigmarchaeota archaeon]